MMHRVPELAYLAVARFPTIANGIVAFRQRAGGGQFVAHHGLQRSGTNYLRQCLSDLRLRPLNYFDPPRNRPNHKHCRWQEDKSTIANVCRDYRNGHVATTIAELNRLAGYPHGCKHVVIYKQRDDWLVSILNWGLRCKWFADAKEALAQVDAMGRDYDAYHRFWNGLASRHEAEIALVAYDDLTGDPTMLLALCRSLGLSVDARAATRFSGVHANLVHSPRKRRREIGIDDVRGRSLPATPPAGAAGPEDDVPPAAAMLAAVAAKDAAAAAPRRNDAKGT